MEAHQPTEREAFLRSIIEQPEDDLRRLAFADWLEERGETERSDFISVQCELARLPECTVPHFQMKPCRRFIRDTADKPWCVGCREQTDRGNALRRRERELWDFGLYAVFKREVPSGVHVLLPGWTSGRPIESYVRRGFVAEVRCRLEDWIGGEMCPRCEGDGVSLVSDYHRMRNCRHCSGTGRTVGVGPRLVREHPVERVVVTDVVARSGVPGSPFGAVTRQSAGVLFDVAFPKAVGGRIEGDAGVIEDHISRAAIAWAKSTPVPAAAA